MHKVNPGEVMRLEMSKRTDLALRAFGHLESAGDSGGFAMAEAIGTTVNFLPQVLKPLVTRGWIQGTPGRGGGYRLSVDLEVVSVLDLVEAMEGETDQKRCILRGVPCPAPEPCALHDSWGRARDAMLAELGSTSVKSTLAPALRKGESEWQEIR